MDFFILGARQEQDIFVRLIDSVTKQVSLKTFYLYNTSDGNIMIISGISGTLSFIILFLNSVPQVGHISSNF